MTLENWQLVTCRELFTAYCAHVGWSVQQRLQGKQEFAQQLYQEGKDSAQMLKHFFLCQHSEREFLVYRIAQE